MRLFLAGVVFPPGKIIFQNHRGADRVQDGLPLFAEGAALAEEAGGGDGGLALVPHPDGQAAHFGHQVPQLAALLGPGALGAVHIPGQAHHNQFSPVGLGGLADFGRHLGHGFFLDLGFQGGGQDLAGVTDGQPGAAVAIINC